MSKYVQRIFIFSNLDTHHLKGRVSILQELRKVSLEPRSCLWRGLKGIREATVVVVSGCRGVRSTVALSTGLDPDKSILESIASVGRGADTEASADDVAPVTPCLLLGGLDTVTACRNIKLESSVLNWVIEN